MAKRHDDAEYSERGETTPPAEKASRQSDPFSPSSPVRQDCEGTRVNSPINRERVKYETPEPLGIHRSPSVADSHLSKLTRGK